MMLRADQKIGEIVAAFPKATEVFRTYKIDFCCGGGRALKEAIETGGLDEAEVMNALHQAYAEQGKPEGRDWRVEPLGDLIDTIVQTHHTFMKQALPRTSELVTTILRVHGPTHPELFRVHRLFHMLKMEIEGHLIKEEEVLFPQIKQVELNPSPLGVEQARGVLVETEAEHEGAGQILKELREITRGYTAPEDGCGTFEKAYELLEAIERDLFEHIHLENNILFPRFLS